MPHSRRHGIDRLLRSLSRRKEAHRWHHLPDRVVLLRHGESQANVNAGILADRPDNLIDLTARGMEQAREAGCRIKALTRDEPVLLALSPFERARQTALEVYETLPHGQVVCVHTDPRVREQEFGNFQRDQEELRLAGKEAESFGRFYYRRPNGESSADVYDRVSNFLSDLLHDPDGRPFGWQGKRVSTVVVVTHGLTMRLLLMRHFRWSVETCQSIYNPGNCDHWVLDKDARQRRYLFSQADSHPGRLPWACRHVIVHLRTGRQLPFTVIDYLAHPHHRGHLEIPSGQADALGALSSAVPGHRHLDPVRGVDLQEVLAEAAHHAAHDAPRIAEQTVRIDWNPRLSAAASQLRDRARTRRRRDRSSLALGYGIMPTIDHDEECLFNDMDCGR
eukprot:TRINITY_DN70414_c0_g1_i1.p1 TRINITY_DN70414_c0_g1~~TRINITY_DN70414_c0_g1_i1.p1  ORF type:complete len:427 (+),score=124.63 TRINITY_DN70414_c0_g1_i1:106-1281(+)